MHFTEEGSTEIRRREDIKDRSDLRDLFWFEMLEQGFWLTRRGMIALILDTPDEGLSPIRGCRSQVLGGMPISSHCGICLYQLMKMRSWDPATLRKSRYCANGVRNENEERCASVSL